MARSSCGRTLDRAHIIGSPTATPSSCLANSEYGDCPAASSAADEVESTITRPIASNSPLVPRIR